jgi:cytochrome P450
MVGQLEGNQYSDWVQAVLDSIRSIPLAQFINYYPVSRKLFERFEPRVVANKKYRHFRFAADCVNARLARGSEKPDIWSLVLSARGDRSLSLDEMHCHAGIFMLAGSETTGTALSGLTYLLVRHPHKLEILTRELRKRFKNPEEITMEAATGLLTCHKLTGAGNGRGRKYRIAHARYKGKWSKRMAIYSRLKLQEVLLERLVTECLNTPKRGGRDNGVVELVLVAWDEAMAPIGTTASVSQRMYVLFTSQVQSSRAPQ